MKIYWYGDRKNVIGPQVKSLRQKNKLTQKALAEKLQLEGYEFSALTILRIESGTRFAADYEVKALADVFGVKTDDLFPITKEK